MNDTGKINILMVLPDLAVGGVSMVVTDICNNLDKEKFSIKMLLLSKEVPSLSIKPLDKSINVSVIDYVFIDDYSVKGYYKYFFSKTAKINGAIFKSKVLELNPDIVHFHTHPIDLYLGKYVGLKKLLYTDHLVRLDKKEYSSVSRFLLRMLYKKLYSIYHIVSVSMIVAECIEQFKLKNKNRFNFIVNNSVDTNYFINDVKESSKEFTAIYVSRINKVKGHEDLIRAWEMLKFKGPKKLIIAGPDNLNGTIQELINSLGLNNEIEVIGTVSDVKELLKRATIAVFPSHKEGLPISLLEKMAMSLPIVVSDIPELTAIITNNVNGLVFKKGDPSQLAEKIDELTLNFDLRKKLGNEARNTVVEKYSKISEIKEMSRIYELAYNS